MLYGVGGQVACRADHRAFTDAMALTGGVSLRIISGVLKRAGAHVATRCTGLISRDVTGRVSRVISLFSWWGLLWARRSYFRG